MLPGGRLRLYGQISDKPALEWSWVNNQLQEAATYWVVGRTPAHPHPRPVWGVWDGQRLFLSIGMFSTVTLFGAGRARVGDCFRCRT
jgi:hypothetical protein